MVKIAKVVKCLFFILVSWISMSDCMQKEICEDLSQGIVSGSVQSVQLAIGNGANVNEKIYCSEIRSWIKPLLLSIKCLSKVGDSDQEELSNRLRIIELLIKHDAKIDEEAFKVAKLLKSQTVKFMVTKMLDNALQDESPGSSKIIKEN
jgi:hypothetical protein